MLIIKTNVELILLTFKIFIRKNYLPVKRLVRWSLFKIKGVELLLINLGIIIRKYQTKTVYTRRARLGSEKN